MADIVLWQTICKHFNNFKNTLNTASIFTDKVLCKFLELIYAMALFSFAHYQGDYMQYLTAHFEDACSFEWFKTSGKYFVI